MRSSTSRNCCSRSMTAATVTSGFQTMRQDTARAGPSAISRRPCTGAATIGSSAARDPDIALLGRAGLPDGVEFLQILARDRRIAEAGNALGAIGPQAV